MKARGVASAEGAKSQPLPDGVGLARPGPLRRAFIRAESSLAPACILAPARCASVPGRVHPNRRQGMSCAFAGTLRSGRGAGIVTSAVNASAPALDKPDPVAYTDVAIVGGGPGGLAAAAALSRVLHPSVRIQVRRGTRTQLGKCDGP